MLYRRKNTLTKEHILRSLRIAAITIKIRAKTTTKITETLAAIKYIDNQILTADLRDIATSAKKRTAVYRDI